jgi:hypothetical protein
MHFVSVLQSSAGCIATFHTTTQDAFDVFSLWPLQFDRLFKSHCNTSRFCFNVFQMQKVSPDCTTILSPSSCTWRQQLYSVLLADSWESSSSCYQLSHSINAIDPAPHRSGRKREHCSRMFASITHIPSLHKIVGVEEFH